MDQGEHDTKLGRIIARSWADEDFRQRLLADPAAVLRAEGMPIPAGKVLRVVEDTEEVFHLVLPIKTTTARELSDDDLEKVVGGLGPVEARKIPTGKSQYS